LTVVSPPTKPVDVTEHRVASQRVRVKVCGITSPDDALLAIANGADAIGLVFYSASSRYVTIETARKIAMSVGPLVTVVGLFVDATRNEVERVLRRVPLSLLQFHGDETAKFCCSINRPFIKAIRMDDNVDFPTLENEYKDALGFLLDTYKPGQPGGTGEVFDWHRVPSSLTKPIIVAGGLNPENVSEAVELTRPYAVDVSSGVESMPGKKDPEKIMRFIQYAKYSNLSL
jgi:phosphoribosylanthranilate isomerase